MAYLEYVDPESAPEDVASLLEIDEERYGRPSLFARIMAHHPGLLQARQRYTDAVVEEGGLEPTLIELITVAVSATNDCAYCVASHVEHLIEQLGVDEARARAVVRGDYGALDSRERAVVELAEQIARDPALVGPDGIDRLRTVG
ncbi:MAG: carboxymuconolactone decarboxylase family protein, partial [Halobacteriales archaeon]